MTVQHYLKLIRHRWHVIFMTTLVVFVLVTIITLVQPQRYRSTVNLLVVQRYSWNMDAYSASRSTLYLASILSKVIYSQSFFDQVMNAGFGVKNTFSRDPEDRSEEWEKTVSTETLEQTGVIAISVYHTERDQAEKISRAIENVLTTKGEQYHGGGNQVTLKTIDAPYTTARPVLPNIPLNLVAGLVLGFFLGFAIVALFPKFTFAFSVGNIMPAMPTLEALVEDERGSVPLGMRSDFGQPTDLK